MVFESIVVDLINKYLGDYIVKLDKSQLKLGLLGGNVNLENLDIKENAFDNFDLPVKVVQGHINKLTLKIPWKNIYSEPVIAELDGLYVLVLPNSEIKYDAKKEQNYKIESKKKELELIETNKVKRNETKKEAVVKDSFTEKLTAQIVKNLQINIRNIHIRYEDTSTSPSKPFSVGITLANLSFQTCDISGTSIIIKDDSIKDFYKCVKMDSLAVYWNSNTKLFSSLNKATLKVTMNQTISSSSNRLTNITYLIKPISCSAMMQIHMKPEATQFTVPKLSLNLTLDQIGFMLTRSQYGDVTNFVGSIDRTVTKNRFRKYRPDVPLKSDIKKWWKFPYTVVLEEEIRRRRRMWSWECIRAHRQMFHLYADLWEKKMLDKKLTEQDLKQIEKCELELDLLNITLCRQQAEMKVGKLKVKKKAKKLKNKQTNKKAQGGGWFTGWFGKPAAETAVPADGDDDFQKKIRNEFTNEEKEKLYQAIGYSEHTSDPDIPKEYVSLVLNVKLQKLTFLLAEESLKENKLLQLTVYDMSAIVHQRSAAEAIKVGLIMNRMAVIGTRYDDGTIPTLVSTQCQSETTHLLNVHFETNPIDQLANQRINIHAEPLEIIYDSETINRVVKFLTPTEDVRLNELSSQVLASLEEVKEMTATGLRHLAEQRLYTDIKVDIKPSYFIMPDKGKYKKNCKMLLVDLGSILIMSEPLKVAGSIELEKHLKDGKLDYQSLKDHAYDNFSIALSTIQVLMIEQNDDWQRLRCEPCSPNHILKPFGFDFRLQKCIIINDVNLPKLSIKGCLPNLSVSLSNAVLQSVLELILHIPFPETEAPKTVPTSDDIIKNYNEGSFNIRPSSNLTSNQVLRAVDIVPDSETASCTSTIDNEDDDEFKDALEVLDQVKPQKIKNVDKAVQSPNLIDLAANFVINTIELKVYEANNKNGAENIQPQEVASFVVNEIGANVTLKRFDKHIQAYVGSLKLEVPQYTDPSNTQMPLCLAQTMKYSDDKQPLLLINLSIVEKTSPEFVSVYKFTRHTLKCDFKSLTICFHQEAILLLLDFTNSLIPALNPAEKEEKPENWLAKIGDKQGAEEFEENQRMLSEDKKKGLPDTSVLGVITNRMDVSSEKKSVRLQAELEAERIGKRIYIPETNMIQWAITCNLGTFHFIIANNIDKNLLDMSVNGMRADVAVSYHSTEINVNIINLQINDPNPQALYKKIIWIDEGESIFSMQLALLNQDSSTPEYKTDLNKIDIMTNLRVGKINIIFLYSFIQRIQSMIDSFQISLNTVMEKAQEYSANAANKGDALTPKIKFTNQLSTQLGDHVPKISNVLEEPPSTRISIDVAVDAPVIYMPENSKSTNALIIDLGSLTFTNSFSFFQQSLVILEKSDIKLQNLRISRCNLLEEVIQYEKGILKPINVNLQMDRNLSWNKSSQIPQMDIKAVMHSIDLGMSQRDLTMILLILQSNLTEQGSEQNRSTVTQKNQPVAPIPKKEMSREEPITNLSQQKERNVEENIILQFNFQMEYLNIELYKGNSAVDEWVKEVPPEKQFTKMMLENLAIEGHIQLDTAIDVKVALSKISLVDTQIGPSNKINELIRKRTNETKDFIAIKFMQNIQGDRTLLADVAGIYICLSLNYLVALADFFVKAQPPAPPAGNTTNVVQKNENENQSHPQKNKKKPIEPILEPRLNDLKVEAQIERPEILLVEDINNIDSNAIRVQTKMALKYSMLKEKDVINVEISEVQAEFCPFRKETREKHSMDIISPTNISFYCNKPLNDGFQGSLAMEKLIINITPAVIQSISKIVSSLQIESTNENTPNDKQSPSNQETQYIEKFWEMQEFRENQFSFISQGMNQSKNMDNNKIETGFDVSQILEDVEKRKPDQKTDDECLKSCAHRPIGERLYVRLPQIKIILESEVAKKCIPMLIIECSLDGEVKNPSTQLYFDFSISTSVSYFNDHIDVWEPIIEVYPEDNDRQYCFQLQYITCNNAFLDEDGEDLDDSDDMVSIDSPSVSILLISRDNLELTMTKAALDILTNLGKTFEDAYALHLPEHRSVDSAPYTIRNTSGKDVMIFLTEEFDLKALQGDVDENRKLILQDKREIYLHDAKNADVLVAEDKHEKLVRFGFVDSHNLQAVSIFKSETRGLSFDDKEKKHVSAKVGDGGGLSNWDMNVLVISTTAYLGMKTVELRSVVQVINNTENKLSLYFQSSKNSDGNRDYVSIAQVDPGKSHNVQIPVLLQSNGFMCLSAPELQTDISSNSIALWSNGKKGSVSDDHILECKTDTDVVYYFTSDLTTTDIPVGNTALKSSLHTYTLHINVPLVLHNQLPISIGYQSQVFNQVVEPGCQATIRTVCPLQNNVNSKLKITCKYQNKEWFGVLALKMKMEEFTVINFKAKDGYSEITMDLGIHSQIKNGQTSITIYSPYWMINKTGQLLTYKVGDDYLVEQEADNKDAVLFSCLSKSMFSKKKSSKPLNQKSSSSYSVQSLTVSESHSEECLTQPDLNDIPSSPSYNKSYQFAKSVKANLKIRDSAWSDKFSLDTVGNCGKIVCKKKPLSYEIAVKINLSSSGLTKIITFLPYYMILNQSSVTMYCNEVCDDNMWIPVSPGEAVPFWPKSEVGKSMMMRIKLEDSLITQPFPFYESHSILLKLDKKFNGIFVEVQITEEANLINLQLYQTGMALVKLINHLGDEAEIKYKQNGVDEELSLPSSHFTMYAWQDGRQKRELQWRVRDQKKHFSNNLTSDGIGEFYINEMKAYWVSFIWESYRILLFTNNGQVAKHARLTADVEPIDQEITISLHSIGLSLINNFLRQELAYISVTNSGVKWNQIRKKNRQKPLKLLQSELLEAQYNDFLNKKLAGTIGNEDHIVHIEGMEVNLSRKLMLKPDSCPLLRVFEPGVYLQYRKTQHQMHIHLRVYKVQIDNQMADCNFPVVFSAFPPPRLVALDIGLKPLIELSTVIISNSDAEAMRFKYFRILIQEMQLMLDQGFLNSLLEFLSGTVPEYDEEAMFKKDCQIIQNSLIDTPTINSILQGGRKCVFDDFHISPIKIHLSFSLTSVGGSGKTALPSEVLNLFLQSVGIAMTDIQDVIFKLGYFDKQNSIMPTNQMMSAIISHYVTQALRQMYVLVLGLDVLGNPFGVIRGMAQGVEDLFYEPVRGAILGPEEFVDGVTFGVKSLFGHAVGGAAGAVSRIVGTMGKGIAALTLDEEYQRKRREQLSKRPENLGVGLAQGGKGLIFGIVQGVTGVVTKPIDGAKKEGVEGFFKGFGKGLVGVVTRPVSGVVDFASTSFEGIRRATDTNIEVERIRPPRYIPKSGIIRSYGLRKAEGNNIWNTIKEKVDQLPNESYVFHVYCKSRKYVIFLSNERVLQLERNEILGIWLIQWQMPYIKLDGPPKYNEANVTIVFTLKEKQRKLFAKDNITKEIESDPESIKALINKITKIQKSIEAKNEFLNRN